MLIVFTTWKVSVFGVFLVRTFPHSDWKFTNTEIFHAVINAYLQELALFINICFEKKISPDNLKLADTKPISTKEHSLNKEN